MACFALLRKNDGGILRCDGDLFGNGPHKGDQFPGDGHHDLIGVFPPGAQSSIPFAEPYLCLPANILYGFGELFQAQLQVATDFRGIAVRPGPFDECMSSMGVPCLGERALPPPLTAGIFRGRQAQVTHELSGVVKAGQIPEFRDDGDSYGTLPPPQGLQGLDHRLKPPGLHLFVARLVETLQTCGVLVHRPDLFLEDDLLGRGCTDDVSEPAQGGRSPGCLACLADILPQQKRFEPELGRLESPAGIFTRPAQIATGFVFDRGNIDGSEVTRAHQAGQLDGVTTSGFDPVAGLFRHQRGGHDPADEPFFRSIAIEPIPTRAGFIDKDQVLAFRLQLPDELLDIALSTPNGAEEDDLGGVVLGDIGNCERVFVDIHSDVARARLVHG
jgi:hypothetical protein